MEGQFQTSFIPKQPVIQKVPGSAPRKMSVLMRIALIILAIMVLVAGAAFAYQTYLQQSNTKLQNQLDTIIQSFQPDMINSIQTLDTRINTTKQILNQHIALSNFFTVLGKATMPTVRFLSFNYGSSNQKLTVAMTGQAADFASLSNQITEFSKPDYQQYISNPVFSNFTLDKSGNVDFNFTADINPQGFLYANKFSESDSTSTVNTSSSQTPITTGSTSVATTTTSQ